jgi:hypothetical protein
MSRAAHAVKSKAVVRIEVDFLLKWAAAAGATGSQARSAHPSCGCLSEGDERRGS